MKQERNTELKKGRMFMKFSINIPGLYTTARRQPGRGQAFHSQPRPLLLQPVIDVTNGYAGTWCNK